MQGDIFSKEALAPRDQIDSWANIKKNIGDSVSGEFTGWWKTPAQGGYKDQIGLALKQQDGKITGISLNATPYFLNNIQTTQIGDMIGLRYEGEKDTGQMQPAKIIKYYNLSAREREKKGIKSVAVEATMVAPEDAVDASEAGEQKTGFEGTPF